MPGRNDRQLALLPPERIAGSSILVIGVGAIGRQVALQLASAGVPEMTLVDFDTVEEANMGPQSYLPSQVGTAKVDATKADCLRHDPDMKITTINGRFSSRVPDHDIAFCCVDGIETRGLIFKALKDAERRPSLFIDARMSAEVVRILTINDWRTTSYESTLFTADEAYEGDCTARSTIYCANLAAALMVSQFSKYLRRSLLEPDFTFNMLSLEVFSQVPTPA